MQSWENDVEFSIGEIAAVLVFACHDFFERQTGLRKGNREGMPRAEAMTEKAQAVVLHTYSLSA